MSAPKRRTRQRVAVEELLGQAGDFRTAQQIHAQLREAGNDVGLTTVYRSLAIMAEAGEVDILLGDDGEARYRACSAGHHHHLVCRQCGFTVEVIATPVERWAQRTAEENDFTDVAHTLEILGICAKCRHGA